MRTVEPVGSRKGRKDRTRKFVRSRLTCPMGLGIPCLCPPGYGLRTGTSARQGRVLGAVLDRTLWPCLVLCPVTSCAWASQPGVGYLRRRTLESLARAWHEINRVPDSGHCFGRAGGVC